MRLAWVVVVSSLVACTADFSTFESIAGDASQGETAGETAGADGQPFDTGVAVDSGATPDTAMTVDTGMTPDSGMTVDTGMAVDSGKPDTGAPDTGKPDTGVTCTEAESKTLAGHCYFPIGPVTWNQASMQCTTKGAHLVAITSAAEQALVESIRPWGDRWIGMSRMMGTPAVAASYKWITGEMVSYQKWGLGEPAGNGRCVKILASNQWGDEDCTQSFDAICERP